MRRSILLSFVFVAACSGSGVSTTARTGGDDVGEASDGASSAEASADSAEESNDPTGADSGGEADSGEGEAGSSGGSADSADSTPGETSADDSADTNAEPVGLQGAWLSEGENLAPILVQLTAAMSIDATFGPDTFNVVTIDEQGQMVTQLGVYVATPSGVGEIYEIMLEQNMPQALVAEGIFEIDNSVDPPMMRYEVVQTEPDVGALAPTAEGGFGSTSLGSDLTQVFVRQ